MKDRKKASWTGRMLRRNCVLIDSIEGKNIMKDKSDEKTRNKI